MSQMALILWKQNTLFLSGYLIVSGKIFLLLQGQVTFSGVVLSTVLNFVFFPRMDVILCVGVQSQAQQDTRWAVKVKSYVSII